jgi:hypothetical protein
MGQRPEKVSQTIDYKDKINGGVVSPSLRHTVQPLGFSGRQSARNPRFTRLIPILSSAREAKIPFRQRSRSGISPAMQAEVRFRDEVRRDFY